LIEHLDGGKNVRKGVLLELGFGNIENDRYSIADSVARGQGGAMIGVVAMPRSLGGGCQCTRGHCATELIINF
jgi:hypothetical protein